MYYRSESFYKVLGVFVLVLGMSFSCNAAFKLQHRNWVKLSMESNDNSYPLPWMQIILKQKDTKFNQDISSGEHIMLTMQNNFQGSKMGTIQTSIPDDTNKRAFRTYRSFDISFKDNSMKTFNLSIKHKNVTWYLAGNKDASNSFSPSQSFTLQKDPNNAVLFTINNVFSTKNYVESIKNGSGYLNMHYAGSNYASAIVEEGALNFVRALNENGIIRFVKKIFNDQGELIRSENRMPDELNFQMIRSKGFFFIKSKDGKFLQAKQEGKTVAFGEKKSEKWQASWWELVPVDVRERRSTTSPSNNSTIQKPVRIRNVLTGKFLDGVVGPRAIISKTSAGVFILSDEKPEGNILDEDRDKRIYESGRRELSDESSDDKPITLLGKNEKISFGDYILPNAAGPNPLYLPWFVIHNARNKKNDGPVLNGSVVRLNILEYGNNETPFELVIDYNKGQKSFLTYREFIFNIENGEGDNKDKFIFTLSVKHGEKIFYMAYREVTSEGLLLYDVSDFSDMFYLTTQKDKALKLGIEKHFPLDKTIDTIVNAKYLVTKDNYARGASMEINDVKKGFVGLSERGTLMMSDDVTTWKELVFKPLKDNPHAITIQDKNDHFLQTTKAEVVKNSMRIITNTLNLAPIENNELEKAYWYIKPTFSGNGVILHNKFANTVLSIDIGRSSQTNFYFMDQKPE